MQPQIGDSIDRFVIEAIIGEGGMARVYKARDTRLNRPVALKLIRKELFGDAVLQEIRRRFEREALGLASLVHPNIVNVFDYGEYNGAPYLVLAYLSGGTLRERTGTPMPAAQAAALLAPIGRALAYAHKQGIIHRDIKPSNIMFSASGDPLLTDFGIIKLVEGGGSAALTTTGVTIGTPEYMAPEQGLGKPVDERADIYALGVVFFELLTGRRPFHADTPMQVLLKHVSEPLPDPRQAAPGLPAQALAVLHKALAKEPAERFATMGEFALALSGLAGPVESQAGIPAVAAPPAPTAPLPAPMTPAPLTPPSTPAGAPAFDTGKTFQAPLTPPPAPSAPLPAQAIQPTLAQAPLTPPPAPAGAPAFDTGKTLQAPGFPPAATPTEKVSVSPGGAPPFPPPPPASGAAMTTPFTPPMPAGRAAESPPTITPESLLSGRPVTPGAAQAGRAARAAARRAASANPPLQPPPPAAGAAQATPARKLPLALLAAIALALVVIVGGVLAYNQWWGPASQANAVPTFTLFVFATESGGQAGTATPQEALSSPVASETPLSPTPSATPATVTEDPALAVTASASALPPSATPVKPSATQPSVVVKSKTPTSPPVLPSATRTKTPFPPSPTLTGSPIPPTATPTFTTVPPTATRTNTPAPPVTISLSIYCGLKPCPSTITTGSDVVFRGAVTNKTILSLSMYITQTVIGPCKNTILTNTIKDSVAPGSTYYFGEPLTIPLVPKDCLGTYYYSTSVEVIQGTYSASMKFTIALP